MLWHSHIYVADVLNIVNNYVKSDGKYIFDGTVKNLKYLVNNKYLNIDDILNDIPNIKPDDIKILKELLKKHLKNF